MIRNAKVSDADAIQKLNQAELGYDYAIEKTAANLKKLLSDSRHHLLLVFEDNATKKVVAYLHAELYEEIYFDPMYNILALAVSHSYQQQGIGTKLMGELEKRAISHGINEIRLNSGEQRIKAHQFYEKLGYITNKKQKRFGKKLI
ncbi:GNAT family N-acetyltransferase [Lactobacillus bombicola]|uniref:GNAT family N-acetyltransferase n=1 Tax=Lactobacillus bombicola TaxID=1505723 RepID=A0ABX9LUR3_9LACO|nr:GNAT family N-acetyltransferase [Lactobacillus bombicola]RHW52468.1 GNAT family N-acetyltransferase [Lactobacillus bombicola]